MSFCFEIWFVLERNMRTIYATNYWRTHQLKMISCLFGWIAIFMIYLTISNGDYPIIHAWTNGQLGVNISLSEIGSNKIILSRGIELSVRNQNKSGFCCFTGLRYNANTLICKFLKSGWASNVEWQMRDVWH